MTREEAIDIIRKNIPHLGIGAAEMTDALEELIPELRESEDEQSYKRIEQLIRLNTSGAEKTRLLAYLEKQKEQKPISQEDFDAAKHEALFGDSKPAEWSEEDENMYTIMNCVIKSNIRETSLSNHIDRENLFKLKNWLENRFKSIRPQPHWKPSEEQMKALGAAIVFHKNDPYIDMWKSLYDDLQKIR